MARANGRTRRSLLGELFDPRLKGGERRGSGAGLAPKCPALWAAPPPERAAALVPSHRQYIVTIIPRGGSFAAGECGEKASPTVVVLNRAFLLLARFFAQKKVRLRREGGWTLILNCDRFTGMALSIADR